MSGRGRGQPEKLAVFTAFYSFWASAESDEGKLRLLAPVHWVENQCSKIQIGMIPSNLTEEHIEKAISEIDANGVPPERKSLHYDLRINQKRYPPKYVISMACRFATGHEHPFKRFNAVEAKIYFERKGYEIVDRRAEPETKVVPEDYESRFPEGRERFKMHRFLERDANIGRKAKTERILASGKLECEVCGFDFSNFYGEIGKGFVEAHHKTPVAELKGQQTTTISDLALVCANCHRMLHSRAGLLSIDKLRELVRKKRTEG